MTKPAHPSTSTAKQCQKPTLEKIQLLAEINDHLFLISNTMIESLNIIASGKGVIDPQHEARETLGAVHNLLSAGHKATIKE